MAGCTHRIQWLYPTVEPGLWRCVACEQIIAVNDANWTEFEVTHG
jgi:hypothetical protein